ncbi:MAG: hypothetical protein V1826_00945 [bacterium]
MKIILQIFAVIVLVAIFWVAYALVGNFAPGQTDFKNTPQTIGNVGGFHLLHQVTVEDQAKWYRLTITTQMNRESAIASEIATPLTTAKLEDQDQTVQADPTNTITLDKLGAYHLTVTLGDTSQTDAEAQPPEPVFVGPDRQTINRGPMTGLRVIRRVDDGQQIIVLGLTKSVLYRLQSSPDDPGVIWLDILK